MSRDLPPHPSLEHLKKQAKALLRDARNGVPAAVERFRSLPRRSSTSAPTLLQAQRLIAAEYGFPSWSRLAAHITSLAPADPAAALTAAWTANDAARVEALLARHPELKALLHRPLPGAAFGELPIHAAVSSGNREMIDVLLRAGADINARTHWWAGGFGVLGGRQDLTSFLIERGAVVDINAAAQLGMLDKVKELIEANPALVHARGGDGQTALHVAATVEIARHLVDHGADIDARDVDHESTPAQYLVRDHQDIVRFLIARGCRTDILMAAAIGDIDLVRAHLDADPGSIWMSVSEHSFPKLDPRAGGTIYTWTLGANRTPHTVAREFGHEEIVRLLMDRSPLELRLSQACELGEASLVAELVAARPDLPLTLSALDRRRIADAARNDDTRAVRLMLAAGWPTDVRGHDGGTPLHWAAWNGNAEMVRELLRYRPPLEANENPWRSTPLSGGIYASKHGWHPDRGDYPGTVAALIDAGARLPESLDGVDGSDAVLEVLRKRR